MFGMSPEITSSLTLLVVTFLSALAPFIATWLRRKQVEQEKRIEELRNLAVSNTAMLEKNNQITQNIATGTDGIQTKLKEIALRSAVQAIKIKEGSGSPKDFDADELDKIEKILNREGEV